jgi:O-antigen/teichoic acid export membrane protein
VTNLVGALIKCFQLLLRVIFIIYLVKNKPIEVFGALGLIFGVVAVSLYIIGLELHSYINRRNLEINNNLIRLNNRNKQFSSIIVAYIFFVPFLVAIIYFLNLDLYYAPLILLLLIFELLAQECGRYFVYSGQIFRSNVFQLIRSSLWIPVFIISDYYLYIKDTIFIILILSIVSSFICIVYCEYYSKVLRKFKFNFHIKWLRAGMDVGKFYFIIMVILQIQNYLERFIVAKYLGVSKVAILTMYQNIGSIAFILCQTALVGILIPGIFEAINNKLECKIQVINKTNNFIITYSIIIYLLIYLCLPYLFNYIGKNEFLENLNIVPLIFAGYIFSIAAIMPHYGLYASKMDKKLFFISVVIFLSSIGLSVLLISNFDLLGAAWSFFLAMLSMYLIKNYFYKKLLPAKLMLK